MKYPFLIALLFAVSTASASPQLYPSGFQFTKNESINIVISVVESKEDSKKESKTKEKKEKTSLKLHCSPVK